jgi:hypothetical protein
MKYANTEIINNVERVITVLPLSMVPGFNPESPPQENTYAVPDDVEVGWQRLSDGTFTPYIAPPVVPSRCTRRQGRLALLNAGKLDAVETAIDAIADPTAKRQAQIEYEADTWERSNPFLQSMWTALGGTSEELDALFTLAVTL